MVKEERLGLCLIVWMCVCFTGCNLNDLSENIYLPNYEPSIAIILAKDTIRSKNFVSKNHTHASANTGTSSRSWIFVVESTSKFDLEHLTDLQDNEDLSLIFNTLNDFPFTGEIDLIFLNDRGEPVDSLMNNRLFESPGTFDEDLVPVSTTSFVTLEPARIATLNSSSTLKLVTRLSSPIYDYRQLITLFSDNSLIMTLSVSGQVSMNLNNRNQK